MSLAILWNLFLSLDLISTLGVYNRRHKQKVKLEDFKDEITFPSQTTTTLKKKVVLRLHASHKFYSRRKISNIRSKHRKSIGKRCEWNEPILMPLRQVSSIFFSSQEPTDDLSPENISIHRTIIVPHVPDIELKMAANPLIRSKPFSILFLNMHGHGTKMNEKNSL